MTVLVQLKLIYCFHNNECIISVKHFISYLGFEKQSVPVIGLEEYWQYRFKVDASTVKGNATSNMSRTIRTKQGGELFFINVQGKSFIIKIGPYSSYIITDSFVYTLSRGKNVNFIYFLVKHIIILYIL